jgi:hypothetical protein
MSAARHCVAGAENPSVWGDFEGFARRNGSRLHEL